MCLLKLISRNRSTATPPVSKALSPEDPEIRAEFNRIADKPYNVESYNCEDKTLDFSNYVLQKDPHTQIYIKRIKHRTDNYMHAYLLWNGYAYDPTMKPPQYGVEYQKYLKILEKAGFNITEIY